MCIFNLESIQKWQDYLLNERGFAYNTRLFYERGLKHDLEEVSSLPPNKQEDAALCVQCALKAIAKKTPGAIGMRLSALRSYLTYLDRKDLIELLEGHGTKRGRFLPRFLSSTDCRRLVYTPNDQTELGIRDQAILEMLWGAGLRATELCALKVEDLDLRARTAKVFGKGGKHRMVVFNQHTAGAVKRHLDTVGCAFSGNVFCSDGGTPLSRVDIFRLVRKHARTCGMEAHPHTLRHSFATGLVSGGANLRVVADLMGHTNPETTALYVHCDVKRLRKVHAMLGR